MKRKLVAAALGFAVLLPACASTRAYPDRYPPRTARYSSYDEGFKRGLMAGGWAGYRDVGKPYRHDYWKDGQYRVATEGYRPEYGSRTAYADGFREGYARGYRERRAREGDLHRR